MQTPVSAPTPTAEQLAIRLLYLQGQEKTVKDQISKLKEDLEAMHAAHAIATKTECNALFNDGITKKVRLAREATGTYFKVGDDFKDEFTGESHKLQAKYLKAGKAEMADKAHTWKVRVLK
jgi:uncharacterized protein YnzC (UPF0291/DUF896 family)